MGELEPSPSTDRKAVVLALVALALGSGVFAFVGFILAFFTDPCAVASTTCDAGLVAVGTAVASVIPWLLTVGATFAVAIRIRGGQPIGRVPWVSLAGALAVAAIGVCIVYVGGGFGIEVLGGGEPPPEE